MKVGVDGNTTSHPQIIGNAQTSTTIELSSDGDAYTLHAIAIATDVYVPRFCYDYAYQQNNRYFTEDNNGSKDPRIEGSVSTGSNVAVSIFIRNEIESDLTATDMNVSILDINTTQATYINNSTQLAKIGDTQANTVAVTSTDSNITNIFVGDVGPSEHFYIYYSLNPKQSDLNMSLNVQANYNLTLNGTTLAYTLTLGAEIPLCTDTNFIYTPETGVFNVVHNNYYPHNDGNNYYNLPTQVTQRPGNFKVIGLDENDHNQLAGKSTIVAVELIDAAAFHSTYASCQEQESAISERIWINFDNNVTQSAFTQSAINTSIGLNNTIADAKSYYKEARENTAFRISYNVNQDDGSLVQTEELNGEYKILNYAEIVGVVGECVNNVIYPLNNENNDIVQACGNSGNYISKAHLQACMECIYGTSVRRVCSRDNFSLRPEAFLINIDDQNQSNTSIQARLTTGTLPPVLNLAAGYNYNIEINATNHQNDDASPGYSQFFDSSISDTALYYWEGPTSGVCNDEADKNVSANFINGEIDTNTSVNQVGEYRLSLLDTSWTSVDNTEVYMKHHTAPYFLIIDSITGGFEEDCIVGESSTETINSLTKNGCNISSEHINPLNSKEYKDINISFHPYSFDLSDLNRSVGLNHTPVSSNSYIYMADLSKDQNMSYHINGQIRARGENNESLSNFVSGCYAKALDINLTKTDTTNTVAYQYIINNSNVSDLNNTNNIIKLGEGNFTKILAGSSDTILNLNFYRDINNSVNPESLDFSKYTVHCTDGDLNCKYTADTDGTTIKYKETNASLDLNDTVAHYYGRTNAPRSRFSANTAQKAFIYYEVYCNGNNCDKTFLQNNNASKYTDDPRWFINENHSSDFGTAGTVTQKGSAGLVTVDAGGAPTGNHPDFVTITYDGTKGNPYKTTMENDASSWLLYNKYNNSDTNNEFEVEFEGPPSSWAGKHETNTTTNRSGTEKVNRRSMW
ncbi:MAG: hypothetical protein Q9M43_01300 [Sulfurimonas sp.]|nr:hypothetical protein [Sulfurimonas sp.]